MLLATLLLGVAGCTGDSGEPSAGTSGAPFGDDASRSTTAEPTPTAAELPRGGEELLPRYRLFGYSGAPGSEALGRLGIGDLDERAQEIEDAAPQWAGQREPMPVLELIASVAHPVPGADGTYRTHVADEVVSTYLDAAREHDAILLLNIQPGRADFVDELEHWSRWLAEPDVGVALDPEWAVEPGQVPGQVYGQTTGAELDDSAAYLADLVAEHELPEKAMVYHQVHPGVVQGPEALGEHDGVVVIASVDGIGDRLSKVETYDRIVPDLADGVRPGFKLFFEEDTVAGPLMTPEQVLGLDPVPDYVLIE